MKYRYAWAQFCCQFFLEVLEPFVKDGVEDDRAIDLAFNKIPGSANQNGHMPHAFCWTVGTGKALPADLRDNRSSAS